MNNNDKLLIENLLLNKKTKKRKHADSGDENKVIVLKNIKKIKYPKK